MLVEVNVVEVGILPEQVLGQNRTRLAVTKERRQGGRVRALHVEDDGMRIRRRDGGDLIVAVPVGYVVRRVHDRGVRERYVFARERYVVVLL
jgi:hypothetical protein